VIGIISIVQKVPKTLEVQQTEKITSPKTDEIFAVTTINQNISS
jgi:hypothetical protein